MEEENKNMVTGNNKWGLIALICGVLALLMDISFSVIGAELIPSMKKIISNEDAEVIIAVSVIAFLVFSAITIVSGIISLFKKGNKALSIIGIVLVIVTVPVMILLQTKRGEIDIRVKTDMIEIRTVSELYRDNHGNSYVGLDKAPEIIRKILRIKEDIAKYKGENFSLSINPDGSQYCAKVFTSYRKNWFCVDSTGYSGSTANCSAEHTSCQ